MPKIQKRRQKEGLVDNTVLVEDTSRTSPEYLNVTELGDNLALGKNGFKIQGSGLFEPGTELKVEVLDVDGNRVYHETRDYKEGVSRIVSVYVYSDASVGKGSITVTGVLRRRADGTRIPAAWKGKENFRWTRAVNIDNNVYNTSTIRFEREPEVRLDTEAYEAKPPVSEPERVRLGDPAFEPVEDPADPAPSPGAVSFKSFPPQFGYSSLIARAEGFEWLAEMEGEDLIVSSDALPLEQDLVTTVGDVVNTDVAELDVETDVYAGYLQKFSARSESRFYLGYQPEAQAREEGETEYYKNLQIGFLSTFTGQVAEVRVFNRALEDQEDFSYVGRFPVQPRRLFVRQNDDRPRLVDPGGDFGEQRNIDDFAESPDYQLSADSGTLLDSVRCAPDGSAFRRDVNVNFGSTELRRFSFFEYAEYTLSFDTVFTSDVPDTFEYSVYVSGGAITGDEKLVSATTFSERTYVEASPEINFFTDITAESYQTNGGSVKAEPEPFEITFSITGASDDHRLHISDVRLTPAQEAGFSPDYTILRVPVDDARVDGGRVEDLEYRIDLYDTNNNRAGIQLFS